MSELHAEEISFFHSHTLGIGLDEVGRGPIAGPVVAAACQVELLDGALGFGPVLQWLEKCGVKDSKKLSATQRPQVLRKLGVQTLSCDENCLLSFEEANIKTLTISIAEISPLVIDEINILQASWRAMEQAYMKLNHPQFAKAAVLVDGPYLPPLLPEVSQKAPWIKGDSRSLLIGLAAIAAKEYRDDLMKQEDLKYPGYGLARHAGYPTAQHLEALKKLGVTSIHRRSFKPVKELCE